MYFIFCFFLVLFVAYSTLTAWINLFCIKTIMPKIPEQDGTHFCQQCNSPIGYRRDGIEMLNTNFVERSNDLELPSNVIKLF